MSQGSSGCTTDRVDASHPSFFNCKQGVGERKKTVMSLAFLAFLIESVERSDERANTKLYKLSIVFHSPVRSFIIGLLCVAVI